MRSRLTITLKKSLVEKLDGVVDHVRIRNRSHAIEYLLNKALYAEEIMAVVLVGGEGTRMRPFSYEMPKSLLPVANKPLLGYLLEQLRLNSIKNILLSTGAQEAKIREKFGNGERAGVNLSYSSEKINLGTGGAIKHAKSQIKTSPFIVVHGDIFTRLDFQELLSFHQKSTNVVTMALKVVQNPREFGQISLKGNRVTAFYQSPSEGQTNLINLGVYICSEEIFDYFPQKSNFSFEDVLAKLVPKKLVGGYVADELWFDVGTPEDYERVINTVTSLKRS